MTSKPSDKKSPEKKDDEMPWRRNGEVVGIVPPGRRLAQDARPNAWTASGVKGVRPPGTLKVGEGAATEWILQKEAREAKKKPKPEPRGTSKKHAAQTQKKGSTTIPEPKNLKEFLDILADFARQNLPKDEILIKELMSLVGQSHRAFDVIVCFAVGSALVGQDSKLRGEHQWALERGAKAYFNLARRLDKNVKAPRGLVPETLDPIFFDLPELAMQLPFVYLVWSFLQHLEMLRIDRPKDRKLVLFAKSLFDSFLAGRRVGDRRLEDMFPWSEPAWAPEDLD